MSAKSTWRVHVIHCVDDVWYYSDDGAPVEGNPRDCGFCDKKDTPEGHDGCLGTLPNIKNACCGHGIYDEAYIQLWSGEVLRGDKAWECINRKH